MIKKSVNVWAAFNINNFDFKINGGLAVYNKAIYYYYSYLALAFIYKLA